MAKKIQRVMRNERLTPEQAARVQQLREEALEERAEVSARFRARKAAKQLTAGIVESLKKQRAALKLSLDDMAERTGMDQASLSRFENLQRENPTVETITRYAAGVGMRVEVRLTEDDNLLPWKRNKPFDLEFCQRVYAHALSKSPSWHTHPSWTKPGTGRLESSRTGRLEFNKTLGHLYVQYIVKIDEIQVAVFLTYLKRAGEAVRDEAIRVLKNNQAAIEEHVERNAGWDFGDEGQPCRFYVSVPVPGGDLSDESVWPELIPDLVDTMRRFQEIVLPLLGYSPDQ